MASYVVSTDQFRVAPPELAPREREALTYVARGYTIQQTARRMGISASTVATYLNRTRDKLNTPTRAQLIRAAVERGF